jgi:hypothetical protein
LPLLLLHIYQVVQLAVKLLQVLALLALELLLPSWPRMTPWLA